MKKTKIICTISDKTCTKEFIKELFKAGMNIVRINSAHLEIDGAEKIVKCVREVSDEIAILIDTKGPEIRINETQPSNGFEISTNEIISISGNTDILCRKGKKPIYKYENKPTDTILSTNCKTLFNDVPIGAKILIDDGEVALSVIDKLDNIIICKTDNGGKIIGHKSVNIPGVEIDLPSLSSRDIMFIKWAIKSNLDFIAHSFVRDDKDLFPIKQIIDEAQSHIKIISKIENKSGVKNIDNILNYCYGVMVARGDLGVEIPAQKIPFIQREIVDKCRARKKPVIIATQMLHTMIERPRPTRAEITDVANAIIQSTDAIMLSGETASGKYPIEAVKTMSIIAKEAENNISVSLNINLKKVTSPIKAVLAKSLVASTLVLPVKAIFIITETGRTGRYLSEFRPLVPIYALCLHSHTIRELAMSYDVYPLPAASTDELIAIRRAADKFIQEGKLKKGDLIGLIGNYGKQPAMSFETI